jgi:murein L,D-transpeptidase YcbB/YkuD
MKVLLEKLTSRGALAFVLVCVVLLFLFFVYAVSRDAQIIRSKDGVIRVIPNGNERIEQLETLLSQSVSQDEFHRLEAKYQHLGREYQIASSRVTRLLAAAGVDMSEGEDVAVRRIEMLAARSRDTERDMSVSLSVIRHEVTLGRTINTNSLATDVRTRGLCMDIQKFLRCVGAYNGEISGEQAATCRAVKQFQKKNGLTADGIIGRKTLKAMERAFEAAESH